MQNTQNSFSQMLNIIDQDLTMTIKQQQAIEQILQETNYPTSGGISSSTNLQSNFIKSRNALDPNKQLNGQNLNSIRFVIPQQHFDVHKDIEALLKQSEESIGKKFEKMRGEQFKRNRIGLQITDEQGKLKQIFQRMDASSQFSQENDLDQQKNELQSKNAIGSEKNNSLKKVRDSQEIFKDKKNGQQLEQQFQNAFDLNIKQLKMNDYDDELFLEDKLTFNDDFNKNKLECSSDQQKDEVQKLQIQLAQGHGNKKVEVEKYPLDQFQQSHILKQKQRSQKILELDQKYPKINVSSMYKHQYPIFKFSKSSTMKYLKYIRRPPSEVKCAVSFYAKNYFKWTILAIQGILYVFVGQDWKQPVIVNPQRSINNPSNYKSIKSLSVSKNNNHLAVSLGSQIILYQIKKQTNQLVLVKNLSSSNELKANLIDVNKLIVYSQKQNPIELVYLDSYKNVGIIKSEQIVFLNRVTQKNINHGLNQVLDFDVFSRNNKFPTYVAMASKTLLAIYKVEPSIELIHISNLHWSNVSQISIRWRYQADIQAKPQLLVSYGNKIYIYKLIQPEDPLKNSKETYLQLHLAYQNHYEIKQMEIISNTHLLLHSNQNIIVVAMPLIPSTDLTQEIQHQNQAIQGLPYEDGLKEKNESASNLDLFESAIVYVTSQKGYKILFTSQQQILFYSKINEQLQIAVLRSLPEYLDQLMIQEGHFRQAFTLLILIYKGINCSFKFSYSPEALAQCIYSAVQCTIGSLILSMNDNIIEYRLSWICQLLVETHNQNMIWSTVYKKLLEKQKHRQKQWENNMFKNSQRQQEKQKNNKFGRESLFQDLMQEAKQSRQPKHIQTKKSIQGPDHQIKSANKFLSHHLSLKPEQTTSAELLGKPPKNLEHVLYDILEVFVLKSFITSMPQEIFFDFVAYECQKKFDIVVEKIITQNKRPYDGPTLLNLLQNEERSYLQLFLFSRAIICDDYDFYTPLMKVLSCYKKYYLIIQSGNETQKSDEVQQKYNNSGLICLWYIAKCLKFQRLPAGLMTLEQKQIIVQSMCVQLLYPTITIKLSNFNFKIFLQTYLLMFIETEIGNMIQQQNQSLVSLYKKLFPTQYQEIMSAPPQQLPSQCEKNQQIFDKSFKQLAVLHLQRTIPLLKKHKLFWAQFKALCFYYNKNQIDYGFETVVDILIIFFENKFHEYNLYVPNSNQQKKVKPRPTLQELQLRLIDYIKPILVQKKDRFYINKLLNFNDRNISYYLYRLDQNYRLALEHYINAKHSNNLIPFIYQLLDDIKEISDQSTREKKFADMKQFLVKNIILLFNIDKFQALEIFYQVGETTQTIHTLIQQNMGNKLNFLTAVLKKSEHEDFYLKEKYLLEHLSQVCLLKQKQMLLYLDQFYYPLDQAIIVCEQKGNLLAKAIFQERCGRLTEAFMSYQKLLRNIIQSNTNNTLYKNNSQKKIKRDVHKYTQQCLRLCKQCAYDPNSGNENNFWLRIITFINGFIKSNSQHKVFLKVQFEKVLQHILTEMFKFLPTTLLIDFFITRGHKLELSLTKQFSIFEKLFTLIKFQIQMVRKSLEISKIDVKSTRKQQMQKRKNGITCQGVCDFCKKLLCDQPSCSIYSCRHSFHKLCHEDIYKCLTCYFQSDNSIFRSNIFGTQLQKLMPQISFNDEKQKKTKRTQNMNIIIQSTEQVKKQSVKKKLKLFDFNNQSYSTTFYDNISSYSENNKGPAMNEQKKQQIQVKD